MVESTPTQAVQLRERILNIPTLAIHDVRVHANDGEVADDMLAHSLGLVPVVSFGGEFVPNFAMSEMCVCKGARCPLCSVQLLVHVRGPRTVYSHDLKSSNPHVTLVPGIPITVLPTDGELKLEAYALMGRLETKWQCASPPPFWTHPIRVRLNPDRVLTKAQMLALVEACPKGVFATIGDIEDVIVADDTKCNGCEECARKGRDFSRTAPPLVDLDYDTATFKFVVEMVGQLRAHAVWNYILMASSF